MPNVVQRDKRDVIRELNSEFIKGRNKRYLKQHLCEVLFREGVVRSRNVVKLKFLNPFANNNMFCCVIDPSVNVFGQRIEIIVKPDHDFRDRKLHFYISIGNSIEEREENKDNHKSSLRKIIRKEEHDIEHDLKKIIRRYKNKLGIKK